VGKGITFDSGGISIKPSTNMHQMKDDMSGAATVMATLQAAGQLQPKVNIIGVIPATENMPSGLALKPGDILRAMNGKTIEVKNTDAEGRLILADAIHYAQILGATHIVDLATLTGSCVIALGHITTGLMGRPQPWVDQVMAASHLAGEKMWPLPLFSDYSSQLKSEVADVANVGGRAAGTITAAKFLEEFVRDELPWVHLDIAGTAWNEENKTYMPIGPTGVGVGTMVELITML
jgi:leucyl aminopeptidase